MATERNLARMCGTRPCVRRVEEGESECDGAHDSSDARMAWGGAFGAGKSGSSSVCARIYFARNVGVGCPGIYVSTLLNSAGPDKSKRVRGGAEAKSPKSSSSREETARVAGAVRARIFLVLLGLGFGFELVENGDETEPLPLASPWRPCSLLC